MRFTVVRTILSVTVSAMTIAALGSCAPDAPPSGDSSDVHVSTGVPAPRNVPGVERQAAALTGSTAAPGVDDAPLAPPKDAQWTLLVYSERGVAHVSDANTLKTNLIRKTGRRDWYVIHSSDESTVYLGYYRTFDDPHDPATSRAQADLQLVKKIELVDTDGQPEKPFERAGFVPVAAPDPVAPPEWNLFNKDRDKNAKDPTRAYWSLQIMAFRGNPLRKEAAVQAVSALRKDGVEAYFYHGETVSSVCIGAWPMSAVEQQNNDGDHTVGDPNKTLVVHGQGVPVGNLPKTDDEGHPLVAVAPVVNIVDDGLKACMKAHPSHAVNYEIGRKRGVDGKLYEDPSFLVVIPRAPGNGFYDSDDVMPADLASGQDAVGQNMRGHVGLLSADGPVNPGASGGTDVAPLPETPGAGHLRRLGGN